MGFHQWLNILQLLHRGKVQRTHRIDFNLRLYELRNRALQCLGRGDISFGLSRVRTRKVGFHHWLNILHLLHRGKVQRPHRIQFDLRLYRLHTWPLQYVRRGCYIRLGLSNLRTRRFQPHGWSDLVHVLLRGDVQRP